MRPERLYLRDMEEAADDIAAFLADQTEDSLSESALLRRAVSQAPAVIGEAAGHVGHAVRARHPQVPWRDVIALRNLVVHAYFGVDWGAVWLTATVDVPQPREQIAAIIAAEFPGGIGPGPD